MDRDKAIIEEAANRAWGADGSGERLAYAQHAARIALELYRSGWQPTDPDVIAVREVIAAAQEAFGGHKAAASWRAGEFDKGEVMQAALAAYRKHKNGEVK